MYQFTPSPNGLWAEGRITLVKKVLKSSKPKNIFQFFTKPKSYGFMYDSVDFRQGIFIILTGTTWSHKIYKFLLLVLNNQIQKICIYLIF